jgi:hypothetical protein
MGDIGVDSSWVWYGYVNWAYRMLRIACGCVEIADFEQATAFVDIAARRPRLSPVPN